MKRDKYRNFSELSRAEKANVDYRIREIRRASPVAIIAPHGGKIEPGTSELAEAIAGDDYNLYCFDGLKSANNSNLHITSTNFDEPRCVALVAAADYVLALHGFGGAGRERLAYLGGLDLVFRNRIGKELRARDFSTADSGRPHLGGLSPKNICHRGRHEKGAQIEISRELRDDMMRKGGTNSFAAFVGATRRAIAATVSG